MADILQNFPWIVLFVVFIGEKLQQLYTIHVLKGTLERAQSASPATTPPPVAPAAPTPAKPAQQSVVVLDQTFVDFVKKQEGYEPKAKWDYKQFTNGYGTKATDANETISEAEAERRLIDELGKALAAVQAFVPANTPIGVEQGLTDATFNLGTAWMKAGLGSAVKAGDWAAAKEHLLQYNHAGGQVLEGLTKRRQAEVAMFDNPL